MISPISNAILGLLKYSGGTYFWYMLIISKHLPIDIIQKQLNFFIYSDSYSFSMRLIPLYFTSYQLN